MDRVAKETFVTELRDRLNKAPVVYLTDFTGLDVKEMTGLRRSCLLYTSPSPRDS